MTRLELIAMTDAARAALPTLQSEETRTNALRAIARALADRTPDILRANAEDIAEAKKNGITDAMLDRLTLTKERITSLASSVLEVVSLPSPLGEETSFTRPNGLLISRVRVPLGVVAMIYEARPNVTVDAASLCLRTGNSVLLRGGKEAYRTNLALVDVMRAAVAAVGVSPDAISLVKDTSHESVDQMLTLRGHIDLLIPRGGKNLIRRVVDGAKVPVIETGAGNCHIYVEASADLEMAVRILDNAKTSRPSVCNAAECLLVDRAIAPVFLPMAKAALDVHHVEWRGDDETCAILPGITHATPEDYDTEYNDYILSCRVVSDVHEAIDHINKHGTHHSEAIISNNEEAVSAFFSEVDAAALYHNASTRFTDGGEFGLGAEIGISTQKLHVRGPFALEALTTTQYRVRGEGQIRE